MKKKWLITILIAIFLMGLYTIPIFAAGDPMDTLVSDMKNIGKVSGAGSSKVRYALNAIIKLIQIAGSGIALVVVSVLGIKYMMASPGEKADYKKTITPILIGCVLLFAASNIAGVIADLGMGFNN